MQFIFAFGLLLSIAHATANNLTLKDSLDGWHPCAVYTFAEEGTSSGTAECAIYTAPLCYPGVCDTPISGDKTMDIFVKRMPATTENTDTATNIWLVAGGPGAASSSMEFMMVDFHARLNGTVNVYSMDHRGTGRSTMLDCAASQATTTGSTRRNDIDVTEVAACAKALGRKYNNLAAFSITSAATDVKNFISEYSNGANTIVYGVSYGSTLVERLMHLDPPTVTGYVLDGIATTTNTSPAKFSFFSTWETDFGEVGDYFLSLCAQDSGCSSHFNQKSLSDSLQDLLTQFDNEPNSTCASLFSTQTSDWGTDAPSFKLRKALGSIFNSLKKRTLIAPLVYRLQRCTSNDVDVVTNFLERLKEDEVYSTPSKTYYYSYPLQYLIMFSEMWESPGPSVAEMNARFENVKLSDGEVYYQAPLYCAFSKEKSPACDELGVGDYDASAISYEHDQYWNKSTTIPSNASVLLLSSKLDAKTPHKYAEYLLDALEGDNKELISFQHVVHGALTWSFLDEQDFASETCGMKIFLSYVRSGADLAALNKSCLDEMPPLNWTTPIDYRNIYLRFLDEQDFASETCGMKIVLSYVRSGADLAALNKSCLDEMPPLNWTTPIDYRNIYLRVIDPYDGIYNVSLSA
ncbi:hypothetical protein PHMEG_0007831 [Phytophthora megakarya]|uniref:Serine protease n=1 Tax=Phytophthora megakarya TaxID=4795 RepID=A0A225WLJ1_9STRA|nr:hypothetical protein PHMEG_0007831 [Phytophthora megakarya]